MKEANGAKYKSLKTLRYVTLDILYNNTMTKQIYKHQIDRGNHNHMLNIVTWDHLIHQTLTILIAAIATVQSNQKCIINYSTSLNQLKFTALMLQN